MKCPWDTNFLNALRMATTGETVRIQLPGGQTAIGILDRIKRASGPVIAVSGRLTGPESGRFFVHAQSLGGVAGDYFGIFELPISRRAFRIEPNGLSGASELVSRSLEEVLCVGLPRPLGGTGAGSTALKQSTLFDADSHESWVEDLDGVALFESLPGAGPVIYLDFHGGETASWGGIQYGPAAFQNQAIHEIWWRVSEDYRPFKLNVVTDRAAYDRAPANSRQRVIITPTDDASPGAGGVAYTGSFNSTEDLPCWVFVTNNARYCAEAISHEVGHTLGLSHSGLWANGTLTEYFSGHGSGETGWAPIMGLPYYRNVTQWSQGEYENANQLQDQLRVIVSQNRMSWRADDSPAALPDARFLEVYDDGHCGANGIMERAGDADAFVFTTQGGQATLTVSPLVPGPNLALDLELLDSGGQPIASHQPSNTLSATVSADLPDGTFLLRVTAAGRGNPLTDGFSSYGSLGSYQVTGTVARAQPADRFQISENAPAGTVLGVLTPRFTDQGSLQYRIVRGNSNGVFAINDQGVLSVAKSQALDFEGLQFTNRNANNLEIGVEIVDHSDALRRESNRRVVVIVTDVPEPPTLRRFSTGLTTQGCFSENCEFSASVLEHSPLGTIVGTAKGEDPDRYSFLSYSLVGGEDVPFEVDSLSGELRVNGELVAAVRNRYDLVLRVSDRTQPVSLSATSIVHVSVELPYPRGTMATAVYPNVEGTSVNDLRLAPEFSLDPSIESRVASFEIPPGIGLIDWQLPDIVGPGLDSASAVLQLASGRDSLVNDGTGGLFLPGSGIIWWETPGGGGLFSLGMSRPTNHFGMALRGYLLPPVTGHYRFWITSQDDSEFWISDTTDPARMAPVAFVTNNGIPLDPREWDRQPGQQSVPIQLAAGYAYAIEALLKVDQGSGHLSVAWECAECGIARDVILGRYLAPRSINYRPRAVGFETVLHEDALAGSRIGRIAVTDVNASDRHLFRLVGGADAGLFDIDQNTGIIHLQGIDPLPLTPQSRYELQVAVVDNGDPALSTSATAVVTVVPKDAITVSSLFHEFWGGITNGPGVGNLQSLERFPSQPDRLQAANDFTFDGGLLGLDWGTRTRALLVPNETGLYQFFLSASGEGQLKFSFDDQPAHSSIIAWTSGGDEPFQWTRKASQASGGLWLLAGSSYYVETLIRSGATLGHFEVGWSGPGLNGTNPIPRTVLRPLDLNQPPALNSTNVVVSSLATNGTLIVQLRASDSPVDTLTFRLLAASPPGLFELNPQTGDITVSQAEALPAWAGTNCVLEVQVQDSGFEDRYPRRLVQATITVRIIDRTPPTSWVGRGMDNRWSTSANWIPNGPVEGGRITFVGLSQRTNHNDLLQRVGLVQFHAGGFEIRGNPVTLSAGLFSNGENTWAIDCRLDANQSFTNFARALNWFGSINGNGHDLTLEVNQMMRLHGALSGSGRLIKTGFGQLVMTTSNRYTGPTVVKAGSLALEGPASIRPSTSLTVESTGILDVRKTESLFTLGLEQELQGAGRVTGPLLIQGRLQLTSPAVTTSLTFSNQLTLAGEVVVNARSTSGPWSAPPVRVLDKLQLGGRLVVQLTTNSRTLSPGDAFELFRADQLTGAFASVDLPPLPPGLEWDTRSLSVDGSLRIILSPPVVLPVRRVGSSAISLRFQTIAGRTYVVETTGELGPESVWTPVTTHQGAGGIQTVNLSIKPATPQRFYRIRTIERTLP
ncbi:MAG: cadherin domain-containing protein [Verrucomicrobiales bacterium]|nr:cadherin domain-containing protein [Verrucomicrobiales bacterium]